MECYEDIIAESHYHAMAEQGGSYVGPAVVEKEEKGDSFCMIPRPALVTLILGGLFSTGLAGLLFRGNAGATEMVPRRAGHVRTVGQDRAVAMAEFEELRNNIEARYGPEPEDGYGAPPVESGRELARELWINYNEDWASRPDWY